MARMSLIKHTQTFAAKHPNGRRAMVLCGFGGSLWHMRRLIRTLTNAGYDVVALDFPFGVLRAGDVTLLPRLVDQVTQFAEDQAANTGEPPLLIGVSLGALMVLNIVRRSKRYDSGVLITGGDIVKIARKLFPRAWRMSYQEHAERWRDINMYTEPVQLKGKRLLFVLPKHDRLVDKQSLRREIAAQHAAGNRLVIIGRRHGHFATIITETILFPRRTLSYLAKVS